jgi:hypothetical protein
MKRILAPLAVAAWCSLAATAQIPRAADGKPLLDGIWEARGTAASGLEAHGASMNLPAGGSLIVDPADGKIPYQDWAAKQRDENYTNRAKEDPLGKCFLAGVPRIMYLPFPFQIFQMPQYVIMAFEYDHATRTVYLNGTKHMDDIDFWMGDSRGRWDGDTLVVDVADNNDQTWLDLAGDFHSGQMKLTERYKRTGPDTLDYRVTVDDPKVYTRPWTFEMTLYRHTEKNFQLYEYECHDYLEDALSAARQSAKGSAQDSAK